MAEEQRQQNIQGEQDINQLLKVRRQKLSVLQEAGKDPFPAGLRAVNIPGNNIPP